MKSSGRRKSRAAALQLMAVPAITVLLLLQASVLPCTAIVTSSSRGVLLPASSGFSSAQLSRRLLQQAGLSASSSTPVTINGNGQDPSLVQAQTGPLPSLIEKLKEKEQKKAAAAPAQAPATTIVLPAPQTAAIPTTTTGGISLATSTPVKVSSPVNVTTPVQQKSLQKAGLSKSVDSLKGPLNTLINLANLAANVAGAGGAIAGAVPAYIDTFLPDCPPPVLDAPAIPGCSVADIATEAAGSLASGFAGFIGNIFPGLASNGPAPAAREGQ